MSNIKQHFCGFKTAFFVDSSYKYLASIIAEDSIWDAMAEVSLPDGWEFKGIDVSGAAGFVITFDISSMPTERDMKEIKNIMDVMEEEEEIIQLNKKIMFDTKELDMWSVYTLTKKMLQIASELWYTTDYQGDYAKIAETMGIDSKPSDSVAPWDVSMMVVRD